ncbi:MAG: hypothetical protein R3F43_18235 [bacterium]
MTWASEAPANEGQQRLKALMQNPSFRARMISEPMLQAVAPLFGWQPGTDVPEEMKDLALKLTLDRGALRERAEKQQRFLSERNVMLKETLDDSVIGRPSPSGHGSRGGLPAAPPRDLRGGHAPRGRPHGRPAAQLQGVLRRPELQGRVLGDPRSVQPGRVGRAASAEYRYASIMDYGGASTPTPRGWASTTTRPSSTCMRVRPRSSTTACPSPAASTSSWSTRTTATSEMLGGDLANLTRRKNRPVAELMAEKQAGVLKNAQLLVQNRGRNPAISSRIAPSPTTTAPTSCAAT